MARPAALGVASAERDAKRACLGLLTYRQPRGFGSAGQTCGRASPKSSKPMLRKRLPFEVGLRAMTSGRAWM